MYKSSLDRINDFKAAVRYGPIFPCCSCEQMMFENGVVVLTNDLLRIIEDQCNGADNYLYSNIFGTKPFDESFKVEVTPNMSKVYICYTCRKYLQKGRMPPMAAANGLKLSFVPSEVMLTELENNLISKRIIFQKIYQLPKSRIAAVKDKIVNIPIGDEDVMNTLKMLPRTPLEGGLVEVKLKRKTAYKNYHRQEFVNPAKVFKAINFLRESNNPFYQEFSCLEEYKERCERQDPEGYDFLFGEKSCEEPSNIGFKPCSVFFVSDSDETWEEIMDTS